MMHLFKFCRALLFLLSFPFWSKAQHVCVMPAYTGYAVPLENSGEDDEGSLFNEKYGLSHWQLENQSIFYYCYIKNTGSLDLSLYLRNSKAGNVLGIDWNNQIFRVEVPGSATFKKVKVGRVVVDHAGFYAIRISCIKKVTADIADIQMLEFSGAAAKDMQCNKKPRRNAASVHLLYPLSDTTKAVGFYNEVTVPDASDRLYSYFMACGFARGYFGMQVNSRTERRIIFSVWDAGTEPTDRNKVIEEDKVQLLGKGDDVIAEGFGNEGTGGHSHFVYNWKAGTTYRFYVTALPDSTTGSTIYTGYFFIPELQKWKLIASFRSPKDAKYLSHLYSFVENFSGLNGNLYRRADFDHQWIRTEKGDWKELTEAVFSCDATGRARDRIDFGGGVENNAFYLWNGGFRQSTAKYGEEFRRKAGSLMPSVDLYRNVDSLAQANRDLQIILQAIHAGQLDTTGSIGGVYYQLLREGTGERVQVNDSITVRYRGWLLNGAVFDETKDQPARFPLNKLIKGWQLGLTKCRNGGKIRLIIPSALAYSIRARSEKIPPNSVLVFDVDILDIKK